MLISKKSNLNKLISKSGEHNKCSFLPANKQTDEMLTPKYFSVGGKMKKITVLMVAVLVLGLTSVLMAEYGAAVPENEVIGGTIPYDAQWTFTDVDQTAKLDAADEAAYEANLIEIINIQVCTNLDSNDSLSVAAKIADVGSTQYWTLPGDYPSGGHKNHANIATTSDFLILANGFTNGITHSGSFNSYQLLTAADQEIINSTNTGATGVGVENATFDIDCQVLLDWLTDCPGAYSITMTLTLSQEDGS